MPLDYYYFSKNHGIICIYRKISVPLQRKMQTITIMKKFFYLFAASLVAFSFASCEPNKPSRPSDDDDSDKPKTKAAFTIEADVISTRAHVTITPSNDEKDYYWGYVNVDHLDEEYTMQQYVEDYLGLSSYSVLKDDGYFHNGQIKENMAHLGKYYIYACYVEEDETTGATKVAGDVVSNVFEYLHVDAMAGEFSVNAYHKVRFFDCNLNDFRDNTEQWMFFGKTTPTTYSLQDLFTWDEMYDVHDPNGFPPSNDQWWYIFKERDHADELFTLATIQVDDEQKFYHGLMILPDNWQTPQGVTLKTAKDLGMEWNESEKAYMSASSSDNCYEQNIFDEKTDWWALEKAGAVFLPAAGANGMAFNSSGYYWSSTTSSDYTKAYKFSFSKDRLSLSALKEPTSKGTSSCVRFVMNAD